VTMCPTLMGASVPSSSRSSWAAVGTSASQQRSKIASSGNCTKAAGCPHGSRRTSSPKFTNYTRVAIGAPLIEHEIVIVYKLSKGADGYFKAYIDNQLVATHTGSIILPEASVAYTKRGIYGQPTNLFMSEYKMVQGPDAYAAIKEA
jgi:hypothetical protein